MTIKKYNLAVFIGRFQPFHLGHQHAIQTALSVADKVLVLIGSASNPRSIKNPFTAAERYSMIHAACANKGECEESLNDNIIYGTINDRPYEENAWITDVQSTVLKHTKPGDKVCIVGYEKDESSYYLRFFPQYDYVDLGFYSIEESRCMDATRVRELLFTGDFPFIRGAVPPEVFKILMAWKATPEYEELKNEYEFIQKYKKQWAGTPYPVNFVAADAVVVQSGHVLLVTRGANPGKGKLAIPGGYVDPKERIFDAAIRELYEETGIKMAEQVIRRCLVAEKVYDDPNRNQHGRVITTGFLFKLDDAKKLPEVKGGDDASKADWYALASLKEEMMYSDHFHIINSLINIANKRG